jgi:hypothetical protein
MMTDMNSSFLSQSSDTSNEPEFLKKYVHPQQTMVDLSRRASLLGQPLTHLSTHDVIGKPLPAFFRTPQSEVPVPHVFLALQEYFFEDSPTRLQNPHLFAKLDHKQMKNVDYIEMNIAFGNYAVLQEITDVSQVGFYFKSVLKYMEEPLCTF